MTTSTLFTFNQVREAILNNTPCDLLQQRDEDNYLVYALVDGCGDLMGDVFEDLEDVVDYVTNDEGVERELAQGQD